ncbi:ABC-2 type transport system permease protein [Arthrobacter sp. CAN_A212]|uniref:ABC transporter permease n=1 Tax=unclassified Arthrobacter TaxID=235627 RepID=UPI0018C92D71|nr:polyketide antibiotic transporter [Arthrobacter sp. CAN_C5]MBP2217495.1 ABC-2 type transport system permease protein [Arthrobacter sp. CAN_C5]
MPGLLRLAVAQVRRDRILLPIWILGIGLLGFATAGAVSSEFSEEGDRRAIMAVATANPSLLFLRGLPDGSGMGAVVFFQGYAFTALLAGLMSTLLVVRHTRADEELGRAELIGSTPLPRSASLGATLLVGCAANLILAGCVAAGCTAAGLPGPGSLTAGAAVGTVGLFFVPVAGLMAQLMPSGRSANGAAASLVGAAYLLRGVGDALGTPNTELTRVTSGWISVLSPIGWGQRSRPFTAPDLLPLVALAVSAAVLAVVVLLIRGRRDLGASLLPERAGRPRAGAGGRSLIGLAWNLQRSTLIGWCVGAAVMGGIAGGLGPVVTDAVEGNNSLAELIGRLVPGIEAQIVYVFTAALIGIAGVLAAAAGIQGVLRMRAEEAEGRAELLLAVPLSRTSWLTANLVLALSSAAAVAAVAGCAATLGFWLAGMTGTPGTELLAASLAHVPAAAVFVAAPAIAFATIPRWSAPVGWGLLVAGLILGQFGELLGLPEWLQALSPFHHSPAMPVEAFDPVPALSMTLIALAGVGLAAYLIQHRDLTT